MLFFNAVSVQNFQNYFEKISFIQQDFAWTAPGLTGRCTVLFSPHWTGPCTPDRAHRPTPAPAAAVRTISRSNFLLQTKS